MSTEALEAVELDAQQVAELEAMQRKSVATRAANTEAFPGPLKDAFAESPPKLHGLQLRPVKAGDFVLLRELDTFLTKYTAVMMEHRQKIIAGLVAAETPPPKPEIKEEQVFELIYLFTIPAKQARAELGKGRDYFRERAMEVIGDKLELDELHDLTTAVMSNFFKAFSTSVTLKSAAKADANAETFPIQPEAGATASAGGSNTSSLSPEGIPPVKSS